MNFKTIIIVFLIVNTAFGAHKPQDSECVFSGKVTDTRGNPLAYANVYLEGKIVGAISDDKGSFYFSCQDSGWVTFICSYVGHRPFNKKIRIKPGDHIYLDVILKQEAIKTRTVTVTASSFTAADEEGVILTALDVVRIPGSAADLFWAVKSFPGLQQVEEGAGLFVRGGDVSETAVYLDGALITHPYKYESPTGGFFGTFSPFLLKGTYFSSGGFSAQYGNALSGVLSMESHDLPDRRQFGVGIGLAAESIFLTMPVIPEKFGFSLSGNISNTKMMFDMNRTRKNFSQYPSAYDFNLNAVYKLNPQSQLKFFLFSEKDKVGLEVDDPEYTSDFTGNASNQLYNLKYSSLIGKKFLFKINTALNRFSQKVDLGVMDLDIEDRLYQIRLTTETEIVNHVTLRTGLELFQFQTLIAGKVPQDKGDVNPDAPFFEVDTDYLSRRDVQFIECEIIPSLGFRMIPGLRGEFESQTGKYRADPRFSVIFPVSTYISITAAWGKYHQNPDPEYFDPYIGNPNLSAMKSTHTILGIYYQKEQTIFRIEGYRKAYRDLLLEDETKNYVNQGYGYAYGIDFFGKKKFGPLSGWVAYSWLKAKRKWLDIPVLASPYFDITHNVTAVFTADLPGNFSLGLSYRYATGKPYTSFPEAYHEARVPDYQKLDLTVSYLCSFFDSNLTVFYLSVSNIFGRINIFDYKYSTDFQSRTAVESSFGRSFYFGVQFNL